MQKKILTCFKLTIINDLKFYFKQKVTYFKKLF